MADESESGREEMADQPVPRDGWSKAQAVATILATVAVPVIVAFAGAAVNSSLKDRDVKLRTTELAIAILREDPKENAETPRLREWATDVIDDYSGVPFPEGAKKELQNNRLTPDFVPPDPVGMVLEEYGVPSKLSDTRKLCVILIRSTDAEIGELGVNEFPKLETGVDDFSVALSRLRFACRTGAYPMRRIPSR